jgi:site-specific recombinase XerD
MGEKKPYKARQPKGSVAITYKTTKQKNARTGEVRTYSYYQASKLIERIDPETGQAFRKRITASAPTKKEALEKIYKIIQFGDKAFEIKPTKPRSKAGTISEALDAWIERKENSSKVRNEVVRKYRSYTDKHLKPDLGNLRLDDKDLADKLNQYFEATLPNKRKMEKVDDEWVETDKPYFTSTSSLLNIYAALSGAMNLAVDKGLIDRNPIKRVERPKAQKRDDNIAQLSHIAVSLLARLKEDDHSEYCRFLLPFLGLRSGERLGIQIQDIKGINTKEAKIHIHSQLEYDVGVGWFISNKTKSGRDRTIPLTEPFLSVVRDYLKRRTAWTKSPEWKPDPKFADLLFLRHDGSLINKKQDTKDWHEILEAYGYPYWQQHANRHITATLLGNQDPPVPIAVVRELLGHYADAMAYYYQTINKKTMKKNLAEYGTGSFARLLDEPLPFDTKGNE